MIRMIFAVVAGCVVATVIILAFEAVGVAIWPAPKEFVDAAKDPEAFKKLAANPELVKTIMAQIPVAALLNVLVAHGVGSFAGGWLSMRIAFKKNFIPPVTVGVLLTVIGIANLLFLPHPLWFTLVDVFLYLPAAYIGAKVAARKAE